ncbi:MAG: type IA DNA topoisomerase [Lachnospiraceae bacterium]|nr:type IA DNA topoisomerase [Lachnospiraceae bacterium]
MGKSVYIAEKPSVGRSFADAIQHRFSQNFKSYDGYMESQDAIITWCVGHLVTMSYPEAYDPALKRWTMETLPFIPDKYLYQIGNGVEKQFKIVSELLNRKDVSTIYVCTDSGREGEYIYRLVDQMANVQGKEKKRVWIDSQTEDEIVRGIAEAKDESEYDNLAASAYLRAKEDYLMGINFSRVLSLKYGNRLGSYINSRYVAIAVGRVMTCVLGMVVRREREIRNFVKTPFFRVLGNFSVAGHSFEGEWRAIQGSKYFETPYLYKENGFKERQTAEELISHLSDGKMIVGEDGIGVLAGVEGTGAGTDEAFAGEDAGLENGVLTKIEKKKENRNPPLLYNLAEIQNDCSKIFKISPDRTLEVIQELYEKKLVTYPRTDARVLSTAISKEIYKNLNGLKNYSIVSDLAAEILAGDSYKNIAKTKYCNDSMITDHYAIIPTGQGLNALSSLPPLSQKVYEVIVRRFLSIFYPPAVYQKISMQIQVKEETFFTSFKVMTEEGFLKCTTWSFAKKKDGASENSSKSGENDASDGNNENNADETEDVKVDEIFLETLSKLKKGATIDTSGYLIKEGETSPPKRYNSGSLILAMESAGNLIEDEDLRAQIKGSGIGTSATRGEILKKLNTKEYLKTNNKTQIVTPSLLGELIFDVVENSIPHLLNAEFTASWEMGLTQVAEGVTSEDEYMEKLSGYITRRTNVVKQLNNSYKLTSLFNEDVKAYK